MTTAREELDGETISSGTPRESSISPGNKEDTRSGPEKGKGIDLVVFSNDDPEDPKNLPRHRKIRIIAILCLLSFSSAFGSSIYAPGEGQIQRTFHVNPEVSSTGLTLYVLGFALGPPLWGPLSEMYGRRLPYVISWPLLVASVAPSAWANNLTVILLFRFFAGVCSACALNNGGGVISDLYANDPRTLRRMTGFYAFCPLSGPIFGSIVGFFVAAHLTHGFWVLRVHWFFVIVLWPLVFAIPETHGPTILSRRAKRLRAEGKTNAYAAHELHNLSTKEFVQSNVGRPITMLFVEPIVIASAVAITLAYSIVYFFFEAFPVVFIEQNNFPFQLGGLPFLGVTIGMIICVTSMDKMTQLSRHIRIPYIEPPGGTPINSPEAGLKVVLIGILLLPVSMFWFAWTSRGDVHWISPTLAGIPFGYSMLAIFYCFLGYSTQAYTIFASSALAANTVARSVIASVLPILAHPLLNNLGTAWGVSIFGFVGLALIPMPIIFVRYGVQLRERSRFGRKAAEMIAGMRKHTVEVEEELAEEGISEQDIERIELGIPDASRKEGSNL